MRPLTLCLPFYRNPGMLLRHYALLGALPADVKANLALIVVDDGSPEGASALPPSIGLRFPVSIYRLLVDIRWNQDACRNLAVRQALSDWVLLTDIDHLTPERLLRACMTLKLDCRCAYNFQRVSEPGMEPYKSHPNSWFMTRELYDEAGGYDERYAGYYGTDGMFRGRVRKVATRVGVIKEALVRVPRSVTLDASTTTYERKTEADGAGIRRVGQEILASGEMTPYRLTFPWKQVW